MQNAKLLLEELTRRIPPGQRQHHNIIVEDGSLIVTLMMVSKYHPIILDDNDLDKSAIELADKIELELIKKITM